MPFEIIRNDLAKVKADAIVNTANPKPRIGSGTDHAIHRDAGPQLLEARKKIGNIAPGEVAVTPAFNLNAQYVIHTVGPVWQGGGKGEEQILRRAYDNALEAAVSHNCRSVAFPLMAAGTYGFPKETAMSIAISAFTNFLMCHKDIRIILVLLEKSVFELAGNLFDDLYSYVDEKYVDATFAEEYGISHCVYSYNELTDRLRRSALGAIVTQQKVPSNLDVLMKNPGESFQRMLFRLIDEKELSDPEVYEAAQMTKQHFSKQIRNNGNPPLKSVAIRLALALQLDYETTQEFLGKAGYTLSQNIPADIIVTYCIKHGEFDLTNINITLDDYELPPLNTVREKKIIEKNEK